ncbi:TPA: DUF4156 domain-containing protein [Legionella pneumophila]|uniref:Outer membrane lipoprotein n=2 Tax=Legionella TaxID=445 RepID=A0A378PH59_9GAMM|nr:MULTISPECIES: DUF4156 domain-containing protein [Legionella]MCA0402239.1 DUF4156 domain-containing protein [Pseudomonadota bacterium]KTD70656.1 putative outer membrane lipoprotein [Legionella steigerwaltii]MBN9229005.1 DUF4156 domain-containing protein [Legionella steelei]MCL9684056.1 DUF4156 domain-containing protein [Legionella maioricensis]MCL9687037.1 DUF4156 domain-containing protein [Legionella maioricensis]
MNTISRYVVPFLVLGFVGCSKNVPLLPEAQHIRVAPPSNNMKHCSDLGKVVAYDVNGVSQSYQSHEHLYQDELNTLKNNTAELGGDTLVITKDKSTFSGNPKTHLVDKHTLEGKAYRCK